MLHFYYNSFSTFALA